MDTVFQAWPKTPRLFKDVVVTEKIDGSNGCVVILKQGEATLDKEECWSTSNVINYVEHDGDYYYIFAQSRKRLVVPGKTSDNFGFAKWVYENASKLVEVLGEGYHYGEWWGHGIARGYGLEKGDRRFSLFNTSRWGHFADPEQTPNVPGLGVVPKLWEGPFDTENIKVLYDELMFAGSQAALGFANPEGIIVYHTASQQVYKVTDNGDVPKWQLQAVKEAA